MVSKTRGGDMVRHHTLSITFLAKTSGPSQIVFPLIYLLTFNYRTYSDLDNNKHILTITNGSSYMAITFLPYQRINLNSGNQRNAKKGDILARDKTGLSHGLILAPRTASRST